METLQSSSKFHLLTDKPYRAFVQTLFIRFTGSFFITLHYIPGEQIYQLYRKPICHPIHVPLHKTKKVQGTGSFCFYKLDKFCFPKGLLIPQKERIYLTFNFLRASHTVPLIYLISGTPEKIKSI